jgi:methionyl-tRNA formyltransferase
MSERIVFMGSPEFAIPILEALHHYFQVTGIVTQPDRPAGRGRVLSPPPVKEIALQFGLPFIQPGRLKDPGVFEQLQSWKPDAIVVAAFGQILRQNVLELPPFGCINIHASLLPRWRGAAPIQAAILAGDESTGISIMRMDAGIDTGEVFLQEEIRVELSDTAETLGSRLAQLGAKMVVDGFPAIFQNRLRSHPQDESKASYAPKIEKEDGLLDFTSSAETLERKVRAFQPWPGSFFKLEGQMCKVTKGRTDKPGILPPKKTGIKEGFPSIGTSDGDFTIEEIQPAGKRIMSGEVFLRGYRQWEKALVIQ